MAVAPKTKAVGGAARIVVWFLVTILMLLLILLAVLSLVRLTDSESIASAPSPSTTLGRPTKSVDSVPLGGADDGAVFCGRQDPIGSAPSSFVIEVTGVADGAELVVAVDLVAADGTRRPRSVDVPLNGSGGSTLVGVPESNGINTVGCIVTAVQLDRRLVLTGY